MVKSIFVTGTGTDVGKTYVSGLLVKKMREYNLNCGYYKPVLSGAITDPYGNKIAGDCQFVVEIANLDINPMNCLSYCFDEAVSPHLAAKREGTKISIDKILSDYNKLKQNYDYMLLEGAGGITCPLIEEENNITLLSELVKTMKKDVLIVADGGLGTINSILTTAEYINNCGLKIKGIILNNFDKNNFMHQDNLYMIEKFGLKVIGVVSCNAQDIDIDKNVLENIFKEDE